MNRRGLPLLLLAVVAAAMAVYLIVDARRHPDGDGAGARARALPAFDRRAIRKIVIRRQRGDLIVLVHAPAPGAPAPAPEWHLDAPGQPAADDGAIDDLLAAIDLAESDRTADVTAEAAGLSPPALEIALETPDGKLALQVGRADATGRGVYARAGAAGPVRVIGPRVLELADRDASAFRDRRVFPVEPQAVTAIAWRSVGGTGELRATEGRWQNGRGEWVASERVAEALRRLLALRADAFATGRTAAGPQGGSRGLAVTAGAARVAVDVGADGEIARGEERLRVAADVIDEAFRSVVAAGVRDDRLVTQLPDTITDITLADDRARVVLQRLHGAWTFLSPKVAYAADTRVVDDWLARLGAVRTATRSGGPHARRLTVTGRYPESVEVSAPADVYALLAPEPLRFRERGVLSFARFDVRGLARTADNGIEKVAIDAAGAWHAPVGKTVDAAAVARVIGALSDLHAQDFVAAPPPGAPAVNVQIAVQPPGEARPANHTVQVWTRASDCVARLDRDTTFTLERAACDALRLDLFAKAD